MLTTPIMNTSDISVINSQCTRGWELAKRSEYWHRFTNDDVHLLKWSAIPFGSHSLILGRLIWNFTNWRSEFRFWIFCLYKWKWTGDDRQSHTKLSYLLTGRRSCVGESLARMELYIFYASWVKAFHIKLETDDTAPNLTASCFGIVQPQPHKLRMVPRS